MVLALTLFIGFMYALHALFVKLSISDTGYVQALILWSLGTGLGGIGLALWAKFNNMPVLEINKIPYGFLAGLTIFIGTFAYIWLFSKGSPLSLTTSIVNTLVVTCAFIFGIFLIKETPSVTNMIGAVFAVVAVYLLSRPTSS